MSNIDYPDWTEALALSMGFTVINDFGSPFAGPSNTPVYQVNTWRALQVIATCKFTGSQAIRVKYTLNFCTSPDGSGIIAQRILTVLFGTTTVENVPVIGPYLFITTTGIDTANYVRVLLVYPTQVERWDAVSLTDGIFHDTGPVATVNPGVSFNINPRLAMRCSLYVFFETGPSTSWTLIGNYYADDNTTRSFFYLDQNYASLAIASTVPVPARPVIFTYTNNGAAATNITFRTFLQTING